MKFKDSLKTILPKRKRANSYKNPIGSFYAPDVNIRTEINLLISDGLINQNVIYEVYDKPQVIIDALTLQPVHVQSVVYSSGHYFEYNKDKISYNGAKAELKHWPTFLSVPNTIFANSKLDLINQLNKIIQSINANKVVFLIDNESNGSSIFNKNITKWKVSAHFLNKNKKYES